MPFEYPLESPKLLLAKGLSKILNPRPVNQSITKVFHSAKAGTKLGFLFHIGKSRFNLKPNPKETALVLSFN